MALEGTLQDMPLGDLFQVFRMGPKTGVLLLVNGDKRGVIYVAEGRVIDAALVCGSDRSLTVAHEEAILQMLLWDDASFVFRHDRASAARPVRVSHDAEWLVMEGMRRRDDPARAMPYQTITLDTRLQLSSLTSSTESSVSLDVNQWRILSQISSGPSLRSICDATGIQPERAIRTVLELMAIGLVEVVVPSPPQRARHRAPRHDPVTTLTPTGAQGSALAPVHTTSVDVTDERPQLGRGLLDAIIRRVRGL